LFFATGFAVTLLTTEKTLPIVFVENQFDSKEDGI
jgi:hypothetical protein